MSGDASTAMDQPSAMPRQRRSDVRLAASLLTAAAIVGLGFAVKLMPGKGVDASALPVETKPAPFADLREAKPEAVKPRPEVPEETKADASGSADAKALDGALKRSATLIAAKRYDEAIVTLNQARPLAGNSAKAYQQIGRALLGKGDASTARDFFTKAIDLDPNLAEAYFDHATASESLGDLQTALGGMRSFLHLVKDANPYRLQVAQARSAIWEWEAQLGRGPWGPTKGVPPGFTAEQIKRDGKGVGVMMQKPETLRPDGTMDFEIKSGQRFPELWKK